MGPSDPNFVGVCFADNVGQLHASREYSAWMLYEAILKIFLSGIVLSRITPGHLPTGVGPSVTATQSLDRRIDPKAHLSTHIRLIIHSVILTNKNLDLVLITC
jgi:hypothetical protein